MVSFYKDNFTYNPHKVEKLLRFLNENYTNLKLNYLKISQNLNFSLKIKISLDSLMSMAVYRRIIFNKLFRLWKLSVFLLFLLVFHHPQVETFLSWTNFSSLKKTTIWKEFSSFLHFLIAFRSRSSAKRKSFFFLVCLSLIYERIYLIISSEKTFSIDK